MQVYFNTRLSYPCRIKSNRPIRLEIDGYPTEGQYEGWYFQGMTIVVKIVGDEKRKFSHWVINDEILRTDDAILQFRLEDPTNIEVVFTLS